MLSIYRVLCEPIGMKNIGFFCEPVCLNIIGLSAQSYSEKRSPCRDKNFFRTTRGLKPPSGEVEILVQFCRVQPKEPDLWPHVLGSEG
jgi:hypothetical protein